MQLCLQRPYLTMGILICPILGYSMVLPILVVFGRWNQVILQMGIGQHDCLRYFLMVQHEKIDQFGGSVDASIWSHIHMFELVIVPKPQDLDISTDWFVNSHGKICLNPPVLMVKSFLFTSNIYQVCHHMVNPPPWWINHTHIYIYIYFREVSKKSWGYPGYFLLIINFHRIFHEINHPLMGSAARCQAHAGCEVIKASAFFA